MMATCAADWKITAPTPEIYMRTVKEHDERSGKSATAVTQSTAERRLNSHVFKPVGIKSAPNDKHMGYALTIRTTHTSQEKERKEQVQHCREPQRPERREHKAVRNVAANGAIANTKHEMEEGTMTKTQYATARGELFKHRWSGGRKRAPVLVLTLLEKGYRVDPEEIMTSETISTVHADADQK